MARQIEGMHEAPGRVEQIERGFLNHNTFENFVLFSHTQPYIVRRAHYRTVTGGTMLSWLTVVSRA